MEQANQNLQDDILQTQQQQQNRRRVMAVSLILCSLYVFSREAVMDASSQNQNKDLIEGDPLSSNGITDIINNNLYAKQILKDTMSSIDGYKELYDSLYKRYNDEISGNQKESPNLVGNTSSDLLFATLCSLRHKTFYGDWKSLFKSGNQLFGFFDNQEGTFEMKIDMGNQDELKITVQMQDDKYIDHKQLAGVINIQKGHNFTIEEREVQVQNLTLIYQLQNQYKLTTYFPQNTTTAIQMNFQFEEMNDPVKYINKYSPIINLSISAEQLTSPVKIAAVLDLEEENSEKSRQSMYYAIFLTALLIVQFFFVIKTMKSFLMQENEEQKFSLLSLSIVFIWDGFFCFLHLIYAINFNVNSFPSKKMDKLIIIFNNRTNSNISLLLLFYI